LSFSEQVDVLLSFFVLLQGMGADVGGELDAAESALNALNLEAKMQRTSIDLVPLLGPLLAQRSPRAQNIYWKVSIVGPPANSTKAHSTASGPAQQILTWLRVQMSSGIRMHSFPGTAFVNRVSLTPSTAATVGSRHCPASVHLRTCAAFPKDGSPENWSMAGVAAVIIAAAGNVDVAMLHNLGKSLPSAGPAVPILLIAVTEVEGQQWAAAWLNIAPRHPCRVVSMMNPGSIIHSSALQLSQQVLVQGLRWLAANAPPQPVLTISRLEDVTRDALSAALSPLHQQQKVLGIYQAVYDARRPIAEACSMAIVQVAAALDAAEESPEAAWKWPPPELCDGPLQRWHSKTYFESLKSSLDDLRSFCLAFGDNSERADNCVGILKGGGGQEAAVFARVGEMQSANEAVVLPSESNIRLRENLSRMQGSPVPAGGQILITNSPSIEASPSRQHKRKWRHSPDGSSVPSDFDVPRAAVHARLRRGIDELKGKLDGHIYQLQKVLLPFYF